MVLDTVPLFVQDGAVPLNHLLFAMLAFTGVVEACVVLPSIHIAVLPPRTGIGEQKYVLSNPRGPDALAACHQIICAISCA